MRRFFERIERPQARLLWEPRGPAWVRKRALAVALCRDLQLVHVVDPFVTEPEYGNPVYDCTASRVRGTPTAMRNSGSCAPP